MILNSANDIMIPILAQRLLLDMRKVCYKASQPAGVGSEFLFGPPTHALDDLPGKCVDRPPTHAPCPQDPGEL